MEMVEESPLPSVLDLDTKSSMKLNHDVEIVPTKMFEREIVRNQERSPEIEVPPNMTEWGTIEPESAKPPKSSGKNGRGRPAKESAVNVIKTEKADTVIIPAKPFKFEKEVRQQLSEVIQYGTQLLDLGIDYGLGVDTQLIPIWQLTEEQAEVFVRILERRAARSEIIRDKVVPKMLEGRDYLEAGMIVVPKAGATIKAIVDNGGIKPKFIKRKEG